MIRDKEEVRGFVLNSQFWNDYEVRRARELASTPVGGYATIIEAVRVCRSSLVRLAYSIL